MLFIGSEWCTILSLQTTGVFSINQHNQQILNIFLEKVRRDYARDVSLVFIYGSAVRD